CIKCAGLRELSWWITDYLQFREEAVSVALHGTLIRMLMAVSSAKGSWYWWLLLPNIFMSMLRPGLSGALSSVAIRWDLPIFTLPLNILVCLHVTYFYLQFQVDIQPNDHLHPPHDSMERLNIPQPTAALSKLMSLALPACTWPFCLSTLIFLFVSSEFPAICRPPLSGVSYPEANRLYHRRLQASEESSAPSAEQQPRRGRDDGQQRT
ncbi:urea transporter 2-like, partial [Pseudoliparis swirei]|uniref:urea transporter 2-like n=1 Tax=Pseudoliparis swirei TaxID=2059687 RepID=UPI0024BD73A2